MRCTRYKRVPRKGGGTVRRCASFSGGRPRSKSSSKSRRRRGKRPFNKGRRCVAYGTRLSPLGRPMRYCRSYGASSAWRARRGGARVVKSTLLPGWIPRGVKPARAARVEMPSAGWNPFSGRHVLDGLGAMLLPVRYASSTRHRGRYGR